MEAHPTKWDWRKKTREHLKRCKKRTVEFQGKVPRGAYKEDGTFEEYAAMFDTIKGLFQYNWNTNSKRRRGEL